MQASRSFKLALVCGGPSPERGISLNSARSVMDHLKESQIEIIPLYVDYQKQFYRISHAQLYSNTPADFDFKLSQTAAWLDPLALVQLLKSVDLVFPAIHGAFGEDGELQALLELYHVPFVGHSSACCQWMFRKHQAAETLRHYGFATLPQIIFSNQTKDPQSLIEDFFHQHALQRAIIKPTIGGSSIGVYSVATPQEAFARLQEIFARGLDDSALLEPFCIGKEFTIVVFENWQGEPVALIPTEVDLSYEHNEIFDYRKKYLPTNQAAYHTPSRFDLSTIHEIRTQAEQIFKLFGMRDFVRLDGWVVKGEGLYFTDINPISGLEQNSFLFRQTSLLGMTHRQALQYILKRACQRYGLIFPSEEKGEIHQSKLPVYVLFGSHNAERQVSLMSGTNVWLKLLQSQHYAPTPFLLDPQGGIWQLPYSFTLNHTVEEIYANCLSAQEDQEKWQNLIDTIRLQLGIETLSCSQPIEMSLNQFMERAQKNKAFVFIALHGGEGENGTLQHHLESYQIPFNGSDSKVSALCMDKYLTGQAIQCLADPDVLTIPKKNVCLAQFEGYSIADFEDLWQKWCQELASQRLIVKPRCDGCSAGIALLQSARDLERYCQFLYQKTVFIPAFTFANQFGPIGMPSSLAGEYLLEPYIETDGIVIEKNQLNFISKEGWIELTVGVLEQGGIYHALNPSITVAEGAILSLEEKFQGGTGINLTPPPQKILSSSATQNIKYLVEKAAQALGIQNYARLDIFFNRLTDKMILIEANTLPGLTPSTVIYHQALAEEPSLTPLALLDKIISSKLNSCELNLAHEQYLFK
jgi:D-alanine--D-alanine ligase